MARDVLIVDDNPQNLKLASLLVTLAGYAAHTAGDSTGALAVLETVTPFAILMDIQLPGMDGLALARQIKQDPAHRDIAIIALTAYAMKGDREKALAAGCDAYITKPIDRQQLKETLDEVSRRRGAVTP
jgi:CheY-like chemotaxis protein